MEDEMGDRAHVKFEFSPEYDAPISAEAPAVWLYTHGWGIDLPEMLKKALAFAMPRWGDEDYGTRLVIESITEPSRGRETGWGVGPRQGDNGDGNRVAIVNWPKQTVELFDHGMCRSRWTFKAYVDADAVSWQSIGEHA